MMIRRSACLPRLPEAFPETVAAVHAIAEHVLCVARHDAIGRIGLVAGVNGVETAPFGPTGRVVAIDGGELVDRDERGERRTEITTLRDAAAFFAVTPGVPAKLWTPVTSVDLDMPLRVDRGALVAMAEWFGFVTEALGGLRDAGAELEPLTLWPEGFDLATTGNRVNYGGPTGDRFHDRPYLYVGPFDRNYPHAEPPFWNAAFGAALPYDRIGSLDEAVAFLVRGHRLTSA